MKPILFFITILFTTVSSGQTTISKNELRHVLTTSYDTTGNDFDIGFPTWITNNHDSAFFRSDTIVFYRNPDLNFCHDSIAFCKTLEWNFFYPDSLEILEWQNISPPLVTRFGDSPGSGAILTPGGRTERKLQFRLLEEYGNLFISTKTALTDWRKYRVLEVRSWKNSDSDVTVTKVKLLKLEKQ